jgi:hypothetical protein
MKSFKDYALHKPNPVYYFLVSLYIIKCSASIKIYSFNLMAVPAQSVVDEVELKQTFLEHLHSIVSPPTFHTIPVLRSEILPKS